MNHDILHRTILRTGPGAADLADDVHTLDDFAEDAVTIVEVRGGTERNEELPAVGVRAAVGHRQDARLAVALRRMKFILEREARPTGPLAQRIASLNHEALDHPVKEGTVVVRLADALAGPRVRPFLRAFGEPDKILDRLRRFLVTEANGKIPFARREIGVNRHRWLLVCSGRKPEDTILQDYNFPS